MRDFLATIRDHVVVFDGGMGATLEQFDLSLEKDYKLPGPLPRGARAQPPGRHPGRPRVDGRGRRGGRGDRHVPGLTPQARRVGPRRAHARDQPQRRRDRAQGGRRGPLRRRLDRPDRASCPPPRTRRSAQIRFRELVEIFAEQAQGLLEGGVDLLIIETAQDILEVKAAIFGAREAFKLVGRSTADPDHRLPAAQRRQDAARHRHQRRAGHARGAEGRRDRPQLLDRPRGHARRDPLPRRVRPVPVHCIPNAGIPHQGPDGETIFPEKPEPLADVLGEFVERYGVSIVGGCCGTTPDHIRAIARARRGPQQLGARPAPRPPHVSSMIAAAPLVQEPRPTIVGERVNSQGSRKAKELLLADDYDGLLQVAEDQVEGGAHVLDLCVALTERQDEDEQMRQRGQEGLADAAGADPGRLDRARRDRDRARPDPRPRDRQLGQPRGRPRQARQGRPDRASSTAPR